MGLTWSCTQAVTIGSDFLDDQKSDLKFLDNFTMNFYTEKTDSVITYSPNVSYQLATYLVGNLNDPIFGHSSAGIFTQPQLPTSALDLKSSNNIDSVILQLRYDTLGLYGDITAEVTLEVFQLTETPDYTRNYYSNQRFDFGKKLGELKFVPHPKDSITVTYNEDTIKSAPHIRMPLDVSAFSDLLLQDSAVFTVQNKFQDYFHGIYIRMSGTENTMLGIALLNSLSGLTFYYDTPVEENHIFKLVFNTFRVNMVNFNHDYRGSPVGTALDLSSDNTNWYVQGMSGVRSYVTIDGLDQIPNAVINQAVLEFYASFPPGDDEVLFPPCNYLITQEQTDTTLNYDTDVRLALAVAQGNHLNPIFDLVFGGKRSDPIPGPPTVYKYEMKVTNKIKEIVAGNKENIIYFNPFSKADYPHRAVLLGPNNTIYAPRLRVTYTVL